MNPLKSELKRYILPSLLNSISYFILTIMDGIFVGNGVGTNALGAVSPSLPYIMLVQAAATLFTCNSIIASVYLGRGDDTGSNQVFMHSSAAVIAVFSVTSLSGIAMPHRIALSLGANATYLDMTTGVSATVALLLASRHYSQKRGRIYIQKFTVPFTTFSMNRMLLMENNAVNAFSTGGTAAFGITFLAGPIICHLFSTEAAACSITIHAPPNHCSVMYSRPAA